MIVPSALIHIPLYHSDENMIGIVGGILVTIQCIILIVSIYPTEKALKKHFNDDGTRRQLPVDISHILGNLITVIFDYQILRKPLKILSL